MSGARGRLGTAAPPSGGEAMSKRRSQVAITIVAALVTGAVVAPFASGGDTTVETDNEFGVSRTINVAGFPVNAESNEFFLDLGVNGRRCVTCHQPDNNMSVTPGGVQKRFRDTGG